MTRRSPGANPGSEQTGEVEAQPSGHLRRSPGIEADLEHLGRRADELGRPVVRQIAGAWYAAVPLLCRAVAEARGDDALLADAPRVLLVVVDEGGRELARIYPATDAQIAEATR
jgi:hypothetical protein